VLYNIKDETILVVGGCFGISTAYHLLKRGFKNVMVVDHSDILPAPDAASTYISQFSPIPSFASKT
jgi:sarcosine oxidase/L-pipecolate oxidase